MKSYPVFKDSVRTMLSKMSEHWGGGAVTDANECAVFVT